MGQQGTCNRLLAGEHYQHPAFVAILAQQQPSTTLYLVQFLTALED
jgi:hypothetical protein